MAAFFGSTNNVEWGLRIDVYELSTNIANNTSVVRVDLYLGRTRSNGYCGGNFNGAINVDGQVQNYSGSLAYPTNISAGQYIYTGITKDFTVVHNADGSRTVGASASWGADFQPNSGSVSGTLGLSNISRQANITSAPNFNDEDNPTITYSNPAGNAVNALQACISLTGAIDDIKYRDIAKTGNSYTFNLTEDERNLLRNATNTSNSRTVKFFIATTIGSNIFRVSVDKTLTVVNANPTFSDFTYKDTNETVTNVIGTNQALVKGLSNLQVTISSANKMITNKKAIAKNYVATIGSKNVSTDYTVSALNIDLGTISSSGTKRLNVRAYDSRNNSALVYKDIIVYDYDKPVINATINRLNNFETTSYLNVAGTYSKLTVDNVNKNTITKLQYRYRETNGSWGNWVNLSNTISDNKFECNEVVLALDNTKAFEFEVQAIDKLSTNTISLFLDVGQSIFMISSNKKACYINGQEILTYEIVDEW